VTARAVLRVDDDFHAVWAGALPAGANRAVDEGGAVRFDECIGYIDRADDLIAASHQIHLAGNHYTGVALVLDGYGVLSAAVAIHARAKAKDGNLATLA